MDAHDLEIWLGIILFGMAVIAFRKPLARLDLRLDKKLWKTNPSARWSDFSLVIVGAFLIGYAVAHIVGFFK